MNTKQEKPQPELPERAPAGWETWFLTGFTAIFLGLVGASVFSDFTPRKLSVVFFLLFWIPLLAIHEGGHAVVARACGWKVDRIVIGFGRTLKRFRVGETHVYLKMLPLSGYVLPRPTDLHAPRLKSTLIYAAGPAFEAIAALGLILGVGPDMVFQLSDSIPVIAVQSFGIAAAIGLFFTLVPHKTQTGGGESWSDGMGILCSWRLPDAYFENQIKASSESGAA